jgi:predicted metal-dependent peptidase
MTARERIQKEVEQWFLTEPVLFSVYCSHRLTMNANMQCPLRSGKGRIEYNPVLIDALRDMDLSELLRVEMIRILLQHPYVRQPLGCHPATLKMASDMVIAPAYRLVWTKLTLPEDFGLPTGQHYEWYAMRLGGMALGMPSDTSRDNQSEDNQSGERGDSQSSGEEQDRQQTADSGQGEEHVEEEQDSSDTQGGESSLEQGYGDEQGGSSGIDNDSHKGNDEASASNKPSSEYTDLWEEDPFQSRMITDIVQSSSQWGSLPGDMVELIKKAAEGKIDYRGVLRMFRSSILAQKRRLTRMRPSRRFGFEQMGSRYDFTTRLLIAIDTSGSVGSEELGRYFRIITSFFKYGIQEIDVLMFDTVVHGDPLPLTEAKKDTQMFKVKGRGGTDFQPPIDYMVAHPQYDGLIILTDGDAPNPAVPAHLRTKLLWVIDNEMSYKHRYESLRKTGRVCLLEL